MEQRSEAGCGLVGELLGPWQASCQQRFEVDQNPLAQSSDFETRVPACINCSRPLKTTRRTGEDDGPRCKGLEGDRESQVPLWKP